MVKKHFSIIIVSLTLSFFSCQKQTVVSSPRYDSGGAYTRTNSSPSYGKSNKGSYSVQAGKAKEEYEKRMIQVAKAKAKKNKEMKKPQYSDKTYFGHKKPPIKNPPGEKKYCKECSMWH